MRYTAAPLLIALAATAVGAPQAVPPQLSALAAKARLDGSITAWCRGEFRPRQAGAFAVGVEASAGAGRYVVLDSDATVVELAAFTRAAGLSCYTPAEARKLDAAIAHSETIHGGIAPRWRTTVVCGFVDETSAVCWQYSPADRAFVKVGEWVT